MEYFGKKNLSIFKHLTFTPNNMAHDTISHHKQNKSSVIILMINLVASERITSTWCNSRKKAKRRKTCKRVKDGNKRGKQ
jgi:hypothetical protein